MAEHNVQTSVGRGRGRAGLYLASRNAAIITRMAGKRQGIGAGSGERAPLGMAAAPVALHRLTERTDSGATLPKTAPGTQTAIRNSARALAVLPISSRGLMKKSGRLAVVAAVVATQAAVSVMAA